MTNRSGPSDDWRWLCEGAVAVLARNPGSLAHRRGAAFLARQAIERGVRNSVDDRVGPDARWASRFLVLATTRPDVDAVRGRSLWSRWSEICHYSAYDLVPLGDDIGRRIEETASWLGALDPEEPAT